MWGPIKEGQSQTKGDNILKKCIGFKKQLNNKLTKLSCYENNIYGRNKGETLSVDNHTARDKEVTWKNQTIKGNTNPIRNIKYKRYGLM